MIWCLLLSAAQTAPILDDPTYKELSRLVGGNWECHPDGDTVIKQHFDFAVEGKVIRGIGSVTVKGKIVLHIQSNLGWDPVTKTVSYVDFHNEDTVYTGHVTLKDGWLNYDFKEFANPAKHYEAKSKLVDNNHYQFSVGKEVLTLERKG